MVRNYILSPHERNILRNKFTIDVIDKDHSTTKYRAKKALEGVYRDLELIYLELDIAPPEWKSVTCRNCGLKFRTARAYHSMAHCWRCGTNIKVLKEPTETKMKSTMISNIVNMDSEDKEE